MFEAMLPWLPLLMPVLPVCPLLPQVPVVPLWPLVPVLPLEVPLCGSVDIDPVEPLCVELPDCELVEGVVWLLDDELV